MDCMSHCSRFWGKGEGCFGVVWSEIDKNCWLKNSTTSTALLRPKNGFHSALVRSGGMDRQDAACLHGDLSVNSLPGVAGIQYTVQCGKFIDGKDDCFSGYTCETGAFAGVFHAKSLEDCVKICTEQHPLCRAVSYNPGLEIGFANCRPRRPIPSTALVRLIKPTLRLQAAQVSTSDVASLAPAQISQVCTRKH
jgi:hypothetical protein